MRVEWIDDEGYRVVGGFQLVVWTQPPRAIGEKMQKDLSKPPKAPLRNAVRVPNTHTTRTGPGVHTHRIRTAFPSSRQRGVLPVQDQMNAKSQPITVQPRKKLTNATPPAPRLSRASAIIVGMK